MAAETKTKTSSTPKDGPWVKFEVSLSKTPFFGGEVPDKSDWGRFQNLINPPDPSCYPKCHNWFQLMATLPKPEPTSIKRPAKVVDPEEKISNETIVKYPSVDKWSSSWKNKESLEVLWLTEKMDGSQWTAEVSADGSKTICGCRGKVKWVDDYSFTKAIEAWNAPAFRALLNRDYIYHGECIQKPRHNVVVYDRIPKRYVILFDIQRRSDKAFLNPEEVAVEAARLGIESAPIIARIDLCDDMYCVAGRPSRRADAAHKVAKMYMNDIVEGRLESCLGGVPEGLVMKPSRLKLVTEGFKEKQHKGCGRSKSSAFFTPTEALEWIGSCYDTPGRIRKGVAHLRDASSPAKTPLLVLEQELDRDGEKECKEDICRLLKLEFASIVKDWQTHLEGQPLDKLNRLTSEIMADKEFNSIVNTRWDNDEEIWATFGPKVLKYARKSLPSVLEILRDENGEQYVEID